MTSLLASLLKPLLVMMAAWFGGKKAGRDAAKIEELESYAETSKKIDAVRPDADAALEWLRDRAKR